MNAEEKYRKYLSITEEALRVVEIAAPEGSWAHDIARDFLNMARSYVDDAKYFAEKGDYLTAICAVSYAHGWIDAGVRAGILRGNSERLFVHR